MEESAMQTYTIQRVAVPDWTAIPTVELTHTGWRAPCLVAARAQACHDGETLFVRLEAEEQEIRATLTGRLDQVCNDSCLEFFFAPLAGDRRYFNFECNPLGNLYVGFGAERPTRVRQIVKKPEMFRVQPFTTAGGWGVTMAIPGDYIRLYMPEFTMSGEAAGNFYKCGDETAVPHYLAWSSLTTDTPDYHRRQDFGILHFA